MRLTTAPALIAALSALALLAAACGSSSPPPTAAPAPTATATAVAVDTPTPTATPTPAATSTAATVTDTEGTTKAYDVDRLADRALDFLTAFTNDLSPRASGTDQERGAADFLAKLFEDLGYSTSVQEFSFEVAEASATLSPGGGEPTEVPALRMYLSGLGEATGDLVHVDLALAEDIPDHGLDGKIALVRRGEIRFEEKIRRIAEAGAAGAIVYNNEPGLFGGRLETQSRIPVVTTSKETGEEILALIEDGDVKATVGVTNEHLPSQNVIAEMPGSDGRVVVVGGHYDTVPGVPGANDNGSGIASIVTVARRDRRVRLPLHRSDHRVRRGGARPVRQRALRAVSERSGENVYSRHVELRRAGRERNSRRDGRLGAPDHRRRAGGSGGDRPEAPAAPTQLGQRPHVLHRRGHSRGLLHGQRLLAHPYA